METNCIIPFGPPLAGQTVATIGFFDGVHLGHRYLIDQVKRIAAHRKKSSLVITFLQHPRQVLSAAYRPALLSTAEEKLGLLKSAGLDGCVFLDFTPEMAALTARDFMSDYLISRFKVGELVVGHDHHFGCDRTLGFADYQETGRELGIEVVASDAFKTAEFTVSSSTVRRLLEGGSVERAGQCLGYAYELDGIVVEGRHVGRDLGFPTANLRPSCADKLVPGRGVYAVEAVVDGCTYGAMLNIGWRPTLNNGADSSIESHIFNFSGDLYGKPLKLRFCRRIRDERRFGTIGELKAQLREDAVAARQFLGL